MYEYTPQRESKTAIYATAFLLIAAFVLMVFPKIFEIPYRWIPQLIGIFALAFAVCMLTRYVFKGFVYTVSDNGGDGNDLSVTEIQGKKRITVCRIGLRSITSAMILTDSNKASLRELARGRKIFNYFVDISPTRQMWIFAEEGGEQLLIKISPDDRLAGILSAHDDGYHA